MSSIVVELWEKVYTELTGSSDITDLVSTNIVRASQVDSLDLVANYAGLIFDIPSNTRVSVDLPMRDLDLIISGVSKEHDEKAIEAAATAISVFDNKSYNLTNIIVNQINYTGDGVTVYWDDELKAYRSDVVFQILGSPK